MFAFWKRAGAEEEREVFEQIRYQEVDWECESEGQDDLLEEVPHVSLVEKSGGSQRQLMIIYILFLAEA
jgi:hypothetical protein